MKVHELAGGSVHLLTGPATFKVVSGTLEVAATPFRAGDALEVPPGKRIPLQIVQAASLEMAYEGDNFVAMEKSSIPPEWDALADRIAREAAKGVLYKVVVLGEVDTGKTFFSTYLANRLLGKIGRAAILDCDTGQSDIGPPGTFGMLVMDKPLVFLTQTPATHLFLLGAHSPGMHFLPAMVGLVEMLEKAKASSAVMIVDTTGWVQGDGGRAIKRAKLDVLRPQIVVLLQRGSELEHLVRHLPAERVVRLPVSKKATPTGQMERKALRERVSTRYFKAAKTIEIPFGQVVTERVYLLSGTPIQLEGTLHAERLSGWEGALVVTPGPSLPDTRTWPKDLGMVRQVVAGSEVGLVVALLDAQGDTLAIGRIDRIDYVHKRFLVRTPYAGAPAMVKAIHVGSLRLGEKGEEAGFIEPGYL